MFASATSFNQDIGRWSVGNVIEMRAMFASAESFNQDINKWNVGNVLKRPFCFAFSTCAPVSDVTF
jgi:surface protein